MFQLRLGATFQLTVCVLESFILLNAFYHLSALRFTFLQLFIKFSRISVVILHFYLHCYTRFHLLCNTMIALTRYTSICKEFSVYANTCLYGCSFVKETIHINMIHGQNLYIIKDATETRVQIELGQTQRFHIPVYIQKTSVSYHLTRSQNSCLCVLHFCYYSILFDQFFMSCYDMSRTLDYDLYKLSFYCSNLVAVCFPRTF